MSAMSPTQISVADVDDVGDSATVVSLYTHTPAPMLQSHSIPIVGAELAKEFDWSRDFLKDH